jgi:hypothetical protein
MIDVSAEFSKVHAGLDEIESRAGESATAPGISAWGIAEHHHHVALVAGSIAMAVGAILRGRGDPGGELSEEARTILGRGKIPRGVGQAPDPMRPAAAPDADTIREAVAKARARWGKVEGRAAEISEAEGRMPHFVLGPLTAAEWVRFASVHGDHHLEIVRDIREAAGG